MLNSKSKFMMKFYFVPCNPLSSNMPSPFPPWIFNFFHIIVILSDKICKISSVPMRLCLREQPNFLCFRILALYPLRLPNVILFLKCNSTKGILKRTLTQIDNQHNLSSAARVRWNSLRVSISKLENPHGFNESFVTSNPNLLFHKGQHQDRGIRRVMSHC